MHTLNDPILAEGPLQLRPVVVPANDAFLEHLRGREVAGDYNWFGDALEEGLDAGGFVVNRLLVTLRDETPIGDASWFGVPYGPNRRSTAWKIGITLLPTTGAEASVVSLSDCWRGTSSTRP